MTEVATESCDLNSDGKCDDADVALFNRALGTHRGDADYNPFADIDADGTVTTTDQTILFSVTSPTGPHDAIPPTTVATASPEANSAGWHRSPVTVTLSATDDAGGEGVAVTYFSVDDPTCSPATPAACSQSLGPIHISTDGVHTLRFFSADRAGNMESAHELTIRIDQTPPGIACRAQPDHLWPPNHKMVPVTITVSPTDGGSGVDSFALVSAAANEGTAADFSGFIPGQAGTRGSVRAERTGTGTGRTYSLVYRGTDIAGNTADCTATVEVAHDQGA